LVKAKQSAQVAREAFRNARKFFPTSGVKSRKRAEGKLAELETIIKNLTVMLRG
jgi:hypothetical protein